MSLAVVAPVVAACGGRTPLPWGGIDGANGNGNGTENRPPGSVSPNVGPRCLAAVPENVVLADGSVTLEIVLDGSGSMDGDNKWIAAAGALHSTLQSLAARDDRSVSVGMLVFSDTMDATSGAGPYPTAADVPPRPLDAQQLSSLNARLETSPSASTPTLAALVGAYRTLDAIASTRRAVVLVSDGVPDGGRLEQQRCVDAASSYASRIKTFAIGIGNFPGDATSYDPAFMGRIAQAGGTAPAGCDPASDDLSATCHFQVTPGGRRAADIAADLVAAFDGIRAQLGPSCEFRLSGSTDSADLARTSVTWVTGDGSRQPVPRSASDGWSFDRATQPTRLSIHGPTCDRILADGASHVEIDFVCQ